MTDTVQEIHSDEVHEGEREYLNCVRRLLIKKENEMACADKTRKMQIRDVNQHYQFELRRVEGDHLSAG